MTDYQTEYANFSWPRPTHYNFARDVIDVWASDKSQQAMLWIDDDGNSESRTFDDISRASKKLCNVLTAAGISRGDTIVLILGRKIAWWEILTASLRMGAVISPGTTQLSAKDIAYRINTAKASCVITDADNAVKVEQVQDQCSTLRSKVLIDGDRDDWVDYAAEMTSASDDFDAADTAGHVLFHLRYDRLS